MNLEDIPEPAETTRDKLSRCVEMIKLSPKAGVAFSGGVDSTFLLAIAARALGKSNVVAFIADSPSLPRVELEQARRLARDLGVELVEFSTDEMSDPRFTTNNPRRCYYCKLAIFGKLKQLALSRGLGVVLSGANADDTSDYRPGLEASDELDVQNPLMDANLGKDEIRALSREMNLPTWNKPAMACLASRIPYGQKITPELLGRIERAEEVLKTLGFAACRVRSHGDVARIEIEPAHFSRALELRERINAEIRACGYVYICLDLQGLRTGSLNETRDAHTASD